MDVGVEWMDGCHHHHRIASFVLGLIQVQIEFKGRAREVTASVAFEGTLDGMVATVQLVQYPLKQMYEGFFDLVGNSRILEGNFALLAEEGQIAGIFLQFINNFLFPLIIPSYIVGIGNCVEQVRYESIGCAGATIRSTALWESIAESGQHQRKSHHVLHNARATGLNDKTTTSVFHPNKVPFALSLRSHPKPVASESGENAGVVVVGIPSSCSKC